MVSTSGGTFIASYCPLWSTVRPHAWVSFSFRRTVWRTVYGALFTTVRLIWS
jgi:hypothetical protein